MARRVMKVDRLITVLGVAVLALGAAILWLVTREGFPRAEPSPRERAERQVRAVQPGWRVRYVEQGRRTGVICGYAGPGRRGQAAAADVIFISRPNRLLLQTDPLRAEFERDLRALCPGFLTRPPQPASTT